MKKSVVIILMFITGHIFSQDHHLHMIGRYDNNSITLRWAPEDAVTWKLGNRNGYLLSKYPVDKKSGKIIENKSVKNQQIRVWPVEKWRPFLDKDKYMPVACGIIYDSIRSAPVESSASFLVKDIDLKNKMGFALLAADFSQQAAIASALSFVDNDIDTNYHYLYELMINEVPSGINIDTAYLEMICRKTVFLPPSIESILSSDSSLQILWERPLNQHLFTAYYIERSVASENKWSRLNAQPFIYAERNDQFNGNYNIFEDLKVADNIRYSYRIIGLTPFGDASEPSDTFQFTFHKKIILPSPDDLKISWINEKDLKLEWKAEDNNKMIKGYLVGRSLSEKEEFDILTTEIISGKMEFLDRNVPLDREFYYKVYAIDMKGNYSESHTIYTHRDDKTPPARPLGLKGIITKDGVVRLAWSVGKEEDLMGYKVYYANDSSHIFSLSQNDLVKDTTYSKIVKLNNLSPKMYFKIQAIDMRHNGSELSEIIAVSKPDSIPPMAAEFVNIIVRDTIADISWLTSKSSDAGTYQLLRKKDGGSFKEIWSGKNVRLNKISDSGLQWNASYTYQLVTIDLSGNKSFSNSNYMINTLPKKKIIPDISSFNTVFDKKNKEVKITWKIPATNVKELQLYKFDANGLLLKKVKLDDVSSYTETNITDGNYKYALTYFTKDGGQSEFATSQIECK